MKSIQSQFDYITQLSLGYWKSQVLIVAIELGIFTLLYKKAQSALEIARILKIDKRAAAMLLNALVGLELLNKDGRLFSNREISNGLLVKGSPIYQGNRILLAMNLWDHWSRLGKAIKTGKPVAFDNADEDVDRERLEVFIAAMHDFAVIKGKQIAQMLDLSGRKELLDLGGGPGSYAIEFVRLNPGLHAAIFDLKDVIKITRRYIETSGLKNRITTMAGDCIKEDYGKGLYDVVFLSNLLHTYDPRINLSIIKKCYRALGCDGIVVIHDFILDTSLTTPPFASIFGLNMLIGTLRGQSYSAGEIKNWLKKAGFRRLKSIKVDPDSSMIIGFK